MSIIVSTHRMSLLGLVDRLLFFERGRLLIDGPRDAVLAKLRDFTRPGFGARQEPVKGSSVATTQVSAAEAEKKSNAPV